MYKKQIFAQTSLRVNEGTEGETIEQKVARIINNNEPIEDGAPIIFTERAEGVLPGYNIRTDRFEVAIDAMDVVDKTHKAKRAERAEAKIKKITDKPGGNDGGAEPTQGTSEPTN